MDDLGREITEVSAGYVVARQHLGEILARHGIGNLNNHQYGWLARPDELDKLLIYSRPPLIINNNSGLIKPIIIGETDYLDTHNTVMGVILDDIIGEGNYNLNFLSSLLKTDSFVEDNWYRLVGRLQHLLASNPAQTQHSQKLKAA